jgi:hypothetical protein
MIYKNILEVDIEVQRINKNKLIKEALLHSNEFAIKKGRPIHERIYNNEHAARLCYHYLIYSHPQYIEISDQAKEKPELENVAYLLREQIIEKIYQVYPWIEKYKENIIVNKHLKQQIKLPSARFADGSFELVENDLSLSMSSIAKLLNENKRIVCIGLSEKKKHSLFYSTDDDALFVVVQYIANGIVKDILPISLHNKVFWNIPDKFVTHAKNLWPKSNKAQNVCVNRNIFHTKTPSVFSITCYMYDASGNNIGLKHLGGFPVGDYSSVDEVVRDKLFLQYVKLKIKENVPKNYSVPTILVKLGSNKKVSPTAYDLRDLPIR